MFAGAAGSRASKPAGRVAESGDRPADVHARRCQRPRPRCARAMARARVRPPCTRRRGSRSPVRARRPRRRGKLIASAALPSSRTMTASPHNRPAHAVGTRAAPQRDQRDDAEQGREQDRGEHEAHAAVGAGRGVERLADCGSALPARQLLGPALGRRGPGDVRSTTSASACPSAPWLSSCLRCAGSAWRSSRRLRHRSTGAWATGCRSPGTVSRVLVDRGVAREVRWSVAAAPRRSPGRPTSASTTSAESTRFI